MTLAQVHALMVAEAPPEREKKRRREAPVGSLADLTALAAMARGGG